MSREEVFGSLLAMVFLVNFVRVVFAPLLQPIAAEFGVTTASLGIVTTAAWLGSAAPRLPTGYLLTRIERHRVVAATGVLLVATATFTAFSASVVDLAVGAFLMGVSSGIYFIAANPLVSELFPDRIARAIGIHGLARQLSAVLAPLAVTVIVLVADWRTTFVAVAVAAAAATMLLIYAARWTNLPSAGVRDRSLLEAGRSQWRIVLTGVVFIGGVGFCWNGLFNLYGGYLEAAKGIDAATGRLLLSFMFAAGIPSFVLIARLGEFYPSIPLILTVGGVFAVGVLVLTVVESVIVIALVSLVIGFCFYLSIPLLDTYLLSSLPDRHRASAYAIYSASMMVIQALGSGVVGTAVESGIPYGTVYRSIALGVGIVVVGLFLLHGVGRLPSARPLA